MKNKKIIIDTKYKKFTSTNDFSNADVFQVSTYCLLHNTNHAILLYPRWDEKTSEIPDYYLNTGNKNIKIYFKTINLKYDNLKNNMLNIREEISQILQN